ncbi:P-loop containing nucleoside triphosphate hydrolase protein [Hyaloscypha sp. PMI_1271]|nr:P-loop containing nucleoside triphosphate hydrolase protein [Hyaloscypha sp. PMI_1271]
MASAISFSDANSGFQAGIINGPANTEFHYHAPPERPETPPNPSIIIPFSRDADFVERGTILDQIDQKCAVLGSRTALVGLGGVGKSQLAIEYAYRIRERSPDTWVFWVHASNATRFEQSFKDIANCVKIPGRQNVKADIFQLVHDWLRNESKGRWVLILDNVDDARFLLDNQPSTSASVSKPLREYLPQSENSCILITTRSREAALKLVEPYDVIAVDPMDITHALALFEKKLGVQEDNKEDIAELVTVLEFMPLAIFQAATYITERWPRCSVRQYLEQFRKSDSKRTSLLDYNGGQLRRDREAKNSIIITWQISFDHIRQTRPSAADLLSLMCFFDRQGIPEAVLRSRGKEGNDQGDRKERDDNDEWDGNEVHSSQSSQSDEFEEDVMALRHFSFISVNTDGITFEMHSLVQLATRKWLEAYGQLEKWKQQFITNLCEHFPTGEYENWVVCQALFPHAKSAATQQPEEQSSLLEWATLLNHAAWYTWRRGRAADTQELAAKSAKARKKVYGQDHEDTLSSIRTLALAYSLGGRWDEAEELEVQILETSKRVLGPEHPSTLISMANLAATYKDNGQWDDAEKIQIEELQICKRVVGPMHPDTLVSMSNLASIYNKQGRWGDAEELGLKVIEAYKRVLSDEHPDTLVSMSNLASVYSNQGRWDDAEELAVQVMERRKKNLGTDHPDTLTSMNNLAFTWKAQGRNVEAIGLMRECVWLRERKLGPDHPQFIASSHYLADWDAEQGEAHPPAHEGVVEDAGT